MKSCQRSTSRTTQQVDCDHALALLLRAADGRGIDLSHDLAATDEPLPHGPLFLAWLQSGEDAVSLGADGQGWQWAR